MVDSLFADTGQHGGLTTVIAKLPQSTL